MAEDIFRILVNDADVRVREALAETLSKVPNVPRDVALALAHDVKSVSLPVIRASEVLDDHDLLRLIADNDNEKNLAIADRNGLSETLADALVSLGDETLVSRVISNQSANLSRPTMKDVLDRFGDKSSVQNAMLARRDVPAAISEALISHVSNNILSLIKGRARISDSVLMSIVIHVREQIMLSLSESSDEEQLYELIMSLKERGRLTPSIIVRSICMGDLRFFEMALSVRTGLPLDSVVRLVYDPGERGLLAICKSAGLPEKCHVAVLSALKIAGERELVGVDMDRDQFAKRMIERVLSHSADLGVELEHNDLNYLLDRVGVVATAESA